MTKVKIKQLGFRRFAIMAELIEKAWNEGVSLYPGAQGKPSKFLTW